VVQRLDGGLDGCSSHGKCSTEGEWGEVIVMKMGSKLCVGEKKEY